MKGVLQAFIGSIAIHIIYFVGMMLVGYIKTRNYKPNFTSASDNVEILQNEVVFGNTNSRSPLLYLFTLVGVAVICGIIIVSF